MATYPGLPTQRGSDPEPLTKTNIDRAEDGTARGRNYGDDKVSITVKHPGITEAQRDTLFTFYDDNRIVEFDYESPSDGQTRRMLFVARPKSENKPGNRFDVIVLMEQV